MQLHYQGPRHFLSLSSFPHHTTAQDSDLNFSHHGCQSLERRGKAEGQKECNSQLNVLPTYRKYSKNIKLGSALFSHSVSGCIHFQSHLLACVTYMATQSSHSLQLVLNIITSNHRWVGQPRHLIYPQTLNETDLALKNKPTNTKLHLNDKGSSLGLRGKRVSLQGKETFKEQFYYMPGAMHISVTEIKP